MRVASQIGCEAWWRSCDHDGPGFVARAGATLRPELQRPPSLPTIPRQLPARNAHFVMWGLIGKSTPCDLSDISMFTLNIAFQLLSYLVTTTFGLFLLP